MSRPNIYPPFGGNSPTYNWSPPWLGRFMIGLRSIMISRPPTLPGMVEQGRSTGGVRNVKGDTYGTRLFANWAAGLRAGVPVEGAVAYAPQTTDSGARLGPDGGQHIGPEQAPAGEQSVNWMGHPYTMPGTGQDHDNRPGPGRRDAVGGDSARNDRQASASDYALQVGPNPGADSGIAGSFRVPRQFRMGLGHMAGPDQWGPPFHWDGGPGGDTLRLRPPDIPATDGTNARAIRGVLGSVRQSDTSHIPGVFTPQVIG